MKSKKRKCVIDEQQNSLLALSAFIRVHLWLVSDSKSRQGAPVPRWTPSHSPGAPGDGQSIQRLDVIGMAERAIHECLERMRGRI